MSDEELDSALDEWLDRVSAEYGTAEVRSGFEARVIANVNSRLAKRRLRFGWVSLATAATAALIFLCYALLTPFVDHHRATETIVEKQQGSGLPITTRQGQPSSLAAPVSSTIRGTGRHVHSEKSEIPKHQFLSAGISDQERYLISFVHAVSEQAASEKSVAESGPLQMPDFEITSIQIPKAQVSSINIDLVQLPIAHQSEDPL
jgi:hypothetical protein